MVGKLDKFYVEHEVNGAKIMAHSHQLSPGCIADGEIDTHVELLKADLDARAREMKRRVKSERRLMFVRTGNA